MSRLPTVREFMDRHVQTISPDSDIMDAVDFPLEKRVTGALVANGGGELWWESSPSTTACGC